MKGANMNENKNSGEAIYYVSCITHWGTDIGQYSISPNMPPTPIPESDYMRLRARFDHYENAKVIRIIKPEDATKHEGAKIAVDRARAKKELEFSGGKLPPASMVVSNNQQADNVPTRSVVVKSASEITDGDSDDPNCIAITGNSTRCKSSHIEGYRVCKIHLNQIIKGKQVQDYDGNPLSEESVTC